MQEHLLCFGVNFMCKSPMRGSSAAEQTPTQQLIWGAVLRAGDVVREDDVLLLIDTDKVTIDVRYTQSEPGTLKEYLVKEDDTVSVGQDVVIIETGNVPDEPAAAAAAAEPAAEEEKPPAAEPAKAPEKKAEAPPQPPAAPKQPPTQKKPEPAPKAPPQQPAAVAAVCICMQSTGQLCVYIYDMHLLRRCIWLARQNDDAPNSEG